VDIISSLLPLLKNKREHSYKKREHLTPKIQNIIYSSKVDLLWRDCKEKMLVQHNKKTGKRCNA
jgi:hypothetical protein